MVKIRIGESWKHNPSYVTGLRALAEGTSRGFSPRDIVDVLGIEVDGVDLAQGLAEAALLDAMGELVRAARSLAATDGEERVHLARAPVELKLTRQGDELHLALRVLDGDVALVRDAIVEPRRFFEAVRRAVRTLLTDLTAIHPALGEVRAVRALSLESVRPARRRPPARARSGPPAASTPAADAPAAEAGPDQAPAPLGRQAGSLPVSRPLRAPPIRAPGMRADGLRRLMLRPAWRADAPAARPHLARASDLILILTAAQVEARRPDGSVAWSLPLRDPIASAGAEPTLLVGREAPDVVLIVDGTTGQRLGCARVPLHSPLQEAVCLGGKAVAVSDGASVFGLGPEKRQAAWRFHPRPEGALKLCSAGAGLLVATEAGDLHGLSRDGTVVLRSARALERTRAVAVSAKARLAFLSGQDETGAAALAAVSLFDGRVAWRRVLPGLRPSAPVLASTRVAVGFEGTDGPTLALFDAKTGRPRFQALVPPDGPVLPFAAGRLTGAARLGGGLCLYAPDGTRVANARAADPDPALSPVRPRPVRTGAGLIVVASALLHVYDAARGRLLASLEPAELAPEALALFDGPLVVAAGREGLVEAWRTHGHLRLVD